MILKQHFSLPIWEDQIDTNFRAYADRCLELEKNNFPNKQLSNVGGWQSKNIDMRHGIFAMLQEKVTERVNEACLDISSSFKVVYDNSWININRKDHYNAKHFHPLSSLSACLYVKVPENSGNIIFTGNEMLNHYPLFVESVILERFTTYEPKEGKLLIFPSNMNHQVEKNNSAEPRISIGFNFKQA